MSAEPTGFKGTPGEWHREPMCAYGWDILNNSNRWVADVKRDHGDGPKSEGGFPSDEEGKANAALIAASKDLLAALQDMRAKNAEAAKSGYTDKVALIELYEANATASAAIARAVEVSK